MEVFLEVCSCPALGPADFSPWMSPLPVGLLSEQLPSPAPAPTAAAHCQQCSGAAFGGDLARQQCWFQFCQQLCANEGWFIKGEAEQPAWSRSRVFLEDGDLCAGFFSSLLSV